MEDQRIEYMNSTGQQRATVRVECEQNLPDFCEDINRIVRADSRARITDRSVYSDPKGIRMLLKGRCDFGIYYISNSKGEEGGLNFCSFSRDFENLFDFPLDAPFDESCLWGEAELECREPVCRLLGPRKLQLRAEISAAASVRYNALCELFVAGDDALQKKIKPVTVSVLNSVGEKEFSLQKEVVLPESLGDIASICDSRASMWVKNLSTVSGGVQAQAEALIECSFFSEGSDRSLVSISQSIEFDFELSDEEAASEGEVFCSLYPLDLSIKPQSDDLGDNRVLNISLTYLACCCRICERTFDVVEDCYGVGVDTHPIFSELPFQRLLERFERECEESFSFEAPAAGIVSFESPDVGVSVNDCEVTDKSVKVNCGISLSALGIAGEGVAAKAIHEEKLTLDLNCDKLPELVASNPSLDVEISAQIRDCDIKSGDQSAVCTVNVVLFVKIYSNLVTRAVTAAEVYGEPEVKSPDRLLFYYPEPGEDLWEIGKRYGVDQKSLCIADKNRGFLKIVM